MGQFDYIYFFYGFSFFLLALICFTLDKEKRSKFPWVLLGLFGLIHSFAEWSDMIMIIEGKNCLMSIFNLSALTISFLCLFEFARVGLFRVKGKRISKWVYLFLLPLFYLASRLPLDGWFIMSRYFIGFPAGYLAARVIYEFSKKEDRRPLIVLSIMIGLYAACTGLIVPKADFIPASIINFESFHDLFGIPVQLIRAILALCAALSIWFYASMPSQTEYKPPIRPIRFMPTKWTIAFTLIVFISAGWVFTNLFDYAAMMRLIKENPSPNSSPVDKLTEELDVLEKAALSVSQTPLIINALSSGQPENMQQLNAALEDYKIKYGALNCALIDKRGLAIASVGHSGSEIETGKSYASRNYFKDALSGEYGYGFSLQPKYNDRIYYVGYPVKNNAGRILGAAVIAQSLHFEPTFQYRLFSIAITFLISCLAIIFFIALRKREAFIVFIRKVHAQLEEVDRMKTDFISVISHELRTPLTAIRNAASILIRGGPARRKLDEREKELLEIITNNVDRQTRMISDLLDISKIEAGVMPVSFSSTDITVLIKDVVTSLQTLADEKKINIALALEAYDKTVFADPELVRRILNNLIINAINFTPENGKITVRTEDAGKELKITVSDTGIGISAANQKNLFKKFCRIPGLASQQNKGCGLGLAITKGLVEAQKGRIWLDSEPEKGSSFYFTLPRPE